jgi:hypothetical protein
MSVGECGAYQNMGQVRHGEVKIRNLVDFITCQ